LAKSTRGGPRPNSGPEKGTKYAPTLRREEAETHYRKRWGKRFDELIDAQFSTAVGVKQFVYRDEAGRFKVIDDPDELREKTAQGLAIEIVTRLASPQAQTDVLNRVMGKPKEQLEIAGKDGGPVIFQWNDA